MSETAQTREALVEVIEAVIDLAVNNPNRKEPHNYFFGSECKATATDLLLALEAAGVRQMPVEATEEMLSHFQLKTGENRMRAKLAWDYLLEASPYKAKDTP